MSWKLTCSLVVVLLLGITASTVAENGHVDIIDGLVSHWKMDDAVVPPVVDAVGTNDGTCTQCPTIASGQVDGALDFGASQDGVEVAHDPSLDFDSTTSFSVLMWIHSTQDFSGDKVLIGKYRGSRTKEAVWWLAGGGDGTQLVFSARDSHGITNELAGEQHINDGDWHHLTAIQDRAMDRVCLYVDGNLDAMGNISYTGDFAGTGSVLMGYYGAIGDHNYNGLMDDVRLYNRALSAEEIVQLSIPTGIVDAGPDQALIWRGDPVSVQLQAQVSDDRVAFGSLEFTWEQLSGPEALSFTPSHTIENPCAVFAQPGVYELRLTVSGHNWTMYDDVTIDIVRLRDLPTVYWPLDENTTDVIMHQDSVPPPDRQGPIATSDGKINEAMIFDGSTTALDTPGDGCNWHRNASFSIECWFRTSEASPADSNQVIVGRVDQDRGLRWWVGLDTGGQVVFHLEARRGDSLRVTGTTNLKDGRWHHCVAVRDNFAGENRLYVDGQVAARGSYTYAEGFVSPSALLNIGYLNTGSDQHFAGTLDELLIYPRALTDRDIRSHYYVVRGYLERHTCPVRIMPLGDSITFDNASALDNPIPRPWGQRLSYRYELYELLAEASYYVDFVGSLRAGYDIFPDADNAGYPGFTDAEIARLLDTGYSRSSTYPGAPGPYLAYYPADVILLHIGTNGIDPSPDDVEDILEEIDEHNPDTTVILARIINRISYNTTTTQFNDNIEAMALARAARGDKVLIVDMEYGAGLVYRESPEGDMIDNLHPAPSGYAKMAQVWFAALHNILPEMIIAGDMDRDGCVRAEDLSWFAEYWGQNACAWPTWCNNADLDQLGTVDRHDLEILVENWLRCRMAASNQAPRIYLSEPRHEQSIVLPSTLIAHAQDVDGSVVKVEFLADGSKIGEDRNGLDGWQYTWQGDDRWGLVELRAQATDDAGAVTLSPAIQVNLAKPR